MGDYNGGDIIAGLLGSAGIAVSSSCADALFGETSYEMGSGRTGTVGTISETAKEVAPVSTENPIGTTGFGTTLLTSSGTVNDDPRGAIIFFKDSVPYTRVEKNAVNIYNLIHKNKLPLSKTAIITKTKGTYDIFKNLFWKSTDSFDYEKLDILQRILEKISDDE